METLILTCDKYVGLYKTLREFPARVCIYERNYCNFMTLVTKLLK